MKKILFATTALVFSAGFAAAEVSVSGNARMGVVYGPDSSSTDGNDWNFKSRARVIFDLSGQTDGGLEFGASFRADQASSANKGLGNGGSVYVSGAFGKLEMGNTVSAPEALFGDLPEIGYEDLGSTDNSGLGLADYGQGLFSNDIPYLTGDSAAHSLGTVNDDANPEVLYTYTSGPISLALGMSDGNGADGIGYDNQEYSVAAAYTFDAYTLGLGYEVFDPAAAGAEKETQLELAGTATFGDTDLKAYYASGDDANIVDSAYGLGFSSKFGATTVMGYAQKVSFVDTFALDSTTWWGLGASYDLGGGASVVGGLADNDTDGSDVTADLGMKFKF